LVSAVSSPCGVDESHRPLSSSSFATFKCPDVTAAVSGVSRWLRRSQSAPFASNKRTHAECPPREAATRGVPNTTSSLFASAPARDRGGVG